MSTWNNYEEEFKAMETENETKAFKMNSKAFLVTCKGHLDEDKWIEQIRERLLRRSQSTLPRKKVIITEFWTCHESGSQDTPYEHTHLVIKFSEALVLTGNARFTGCNFFDPDEFTHCNIKVLSSYFEVSIE